MTHIDRDTLLALVDTIPAGRVASYGMLAAMLGNPRHFRLCARLLTNAEGEHPFHRVLHSDGGVCGEWQRAPLLEEGVIFKPNGKVDMRACAWKPL